MLAIGRSVFRPRLHSSLPVAAFSTAADHAATPDGPVAETEVTEARAAGAAAPRAADAASAVPASRPHTRMLRRALIPCRSLLDSRRATGAKPVTYGNPRQTYPRKERLIGWPREDRAARTQGHPRTDRAVRSAGDPHHDRTGPADWRIVLGLGVEDGVVAVVTIGGHVGGQSVLVRHYVYLLRPDQDGHLTPGARDRRGRVERQGAEQCLHRGPADDPLEQVRLPDEARQPRVGRAAVQVLGRRALGDAAVTQGRDPVGDRQRLVLVVGDQHRRGAGAAEDLLDIGADAGPQVRVQRGERLVEQDHGGLDGQRAGQCDPLLLAAGELMRVAPAEPAQTDRLEQAVDLAATAPARPVLASSEPEAHVARHGQVREQAAFLRDVADPAPLRREVGAGAVDQDAADADRAGVRALEPGQQPQQRRLAAAGRAEDGRQAPGRYLQVQAG